MALHILRIEFVYRVGDEIQTFGTIIVLKESAFDFISVFDYLFKSVII